MAWDCPAAAEPLFADCLEICEARYPADNWQIGVARSALGEYLSIQERYAEAETLLVDGYEQLTASGGSMAEQEKALERLVHYFEARDMPLDAEKYRALLDVVVGMKTR